MKRLAALTFACTLLASGVLMAQQTASTTTPQRAYTSVGMHMPFMYFFSPKEGSMELGGVEFKAPISKTFGVELNINRIVVPIKEAEHAGVSDVGFGEEKYNNFQLALLYFMPFNKYIQVKVGAEYYNYAGGYIAVINTPDDCGTLFTLCENCQEDMFGVFGGFNLDVPLYERILIMTSLNYHYVFGDHPSMKKGYIDFTLGIGYQI